MATTTTNLGLTKPLPSEYYNIEVFNENADLIDEFCGAAATQTFVNNLISSGAGLQVVTGSYTADTVRYFTSGGNTINLGFTPRLVITAAIGGQDCKNIIFGTPGNSTVICLTSSVSANGGNVSEVKHSSSTGTDGYIHEGGFTTYSDLSGTSPSSVTVYYTAFK